MGVVTSTDLLELIQKRHTGPGYIVLDEVPDGTGASARRRCDALAIGIWPSHGYAFDGYEIKVSRGDVQRELRDPAKADSIGVYVDRWWLVIPDLKIIDGLAIPDTWGILYPRSQVLRTHRKAPVRKAKPVDRALLAALIRKVCKDWVSRRDHETYVENAETLARGVVAAEVQSDRLQLERSVKDLETKLQQFKDKSGVDIANASWWEMGHIAEAVNMLVESRHSHGHTSVDPRTAVATALHSQAERMRRAVTEYADAASKLARQAESVEALALQYGPPIDLPVDMFETMERVIGTAVDDALAELQRQAGGIGEQIVKEARGAGMYRGLGVATKLGLLDGTRERSSPVVGQSGSAPDL